MADVCLFLLIRILFLCGEIRELRVFAEKKPHPKSRIAKEHYANGTIILGTRSGNDVNPDQFNESTGLHIHPESNNLTELYSNETVELFQANYKPKAKRRRLIEELSYALIPDRDELKIRMLTDPEHPYTNATKGQCFNHVITSFSKACIVSEAFGGWRAIKGFFAVACKALELKRQRIVECINRVCKKFPYLKI